MNLKPLKKTRLGVAIAATIAFSFSSFALAQVESKASISQKFQQLVPFEVVEVNEHVSGLYEIVTATGIFYSSKDGKFLFSGSLHAFENGLPNLTEAKKRQVASGVIAKLKNTLVTYKSPNEKHEVLVFFDSTCGYCRKMHNDIRRYNAMGITVHYALYPRSGLTDRQGNPIPGVAQLSSVACSSNPQFAMNTLMQGGDVAPAQCESPVPMHYQLGQWLGVKGTPAVYDMGGNLVVPGYAPAERLLQSLEMRGQL
ncbi:MAG: hypothetical protein CBB95_17605 [Alteromonas sp. TMED35]|jgi:thiol:disulfide interchange protein DsbC|uniref:thioredoxin fold domain-containing protein n=1 Tax=uncultured Alteromonas sp. TaxID=179113 RepID=UPI000B6A856E|nr:MAG: hypothetical protein CBB95_17605 [Alteromonas sp. TMED35]|tara:strand:- start:19412 stop:20176 length:765 start_codon:yes stop_codon:yes gene_type:complete